MVHLPNGRSPLEQPVRVLVDESIATLVVLHYADGTASTELHVAGPMQKKPRQLATMLHDHANTIANEAPPAGPRPKPPEAGR